MFYNDFMKTQKYTLLILAGLFLTVSSCATLDAFLQETPKPTLSMENVKINSLDMEGITFECQYAINNPYSVAFSIKEVAANVIFEDSTFTKLKTDEGVSVAAKQKKSNSMLVKIPYDSIINFAKNAKGKTSLPFKLDGAVSLDVSSVPLLLEDSFSIPFKKDFEVPVFKPSFATSNPQLHVPTQETIRESLKNAGFSVLKIPQMLAAFTTGNGLKDILSQIDLNFEFTFDLDVKNSGTSPWEFAVDSCALKGTSGELISANPKSKNSITSESGKIPMSVTLNSLNAAEYIFQLFTNKGSNPTFNFESSLSFTDLPYVKNIPLAYSKEIEVSKSKKVFD